MDTRCARLLVVDDDPKLANAIRRALSPEYDVVTFTSGEEALVHLMARGDFDLILCDLSMPEMDGVAFYGLLGSIAPALRRRVLLMTGGAFTPRMWKFLDEVSLPRLEKPFELAELRRAVRALLEQGREPPAVPGSR